MPNGNSIGAAGSQNDKPNAPIVARHHLGFRSPRSEMGRRR